MTTTTFPSTASTAKRVITTSTFQPINPVAVVSDDLIWSNYRSHVLLVSACMKNIHSEQGSVLGSAEGIKLLGYYDRLNPEFFKNEPDKALPDLEFSMKENSLTALLHNGPALLTLLPHKTAYGNFRIPIKVLQGTSRLSTCFHRSIATYCLNYENRSISDVEEKLIFAFDRWIDMGQNGVIFHPSTSSRGIHRFFKSNRSSFCKPFLQYSDPGKTDWTYSLESVLKIRDDLLDLVAFTNGTPTPEQLKEVEPSLHHALLSSALPGWCDSDFHKDLEQLVVEFDNRS